MKYKTPSVVRSVQMYWDFSMQNLNSTIALLGTQTIKLDFLKKRSAIWINFIPYVRFLFSRRITLQQVVPPVTGYSA